MSSLQRECVVEIWSPTTKKIGSGYLIAPDLVLTACHILGEPGQSLPRGLRIEIRPLEDAQKGRSWRSAALGWPKPENWAILSQLDVALLAIDSDEYTRSTARRVPLGWGNLPNDIQLSVTAIGFPRFKQKDNARDTQQIFGDVAPLSGIKSKMFEIEYKGRGPKGHEDWSGISGAALFAQDRLIGVVMLKVEDGYVDFKAARLEEALKNEEFVYLAAKFMAAGPEPKPLRDLSGLVCLADRDRQENAFKPSFVKLLKITPSRPLCCVILGKREHRCDELVNRFTLETIPLLRNRRGEPANFSPISWPQEVSDPEVELGPLRDALWSFLSDPGELTPPDDDTFRARLEDQSRPYLFQSEISVTALNSQQAELFARWLRFWGNLRPQVPGRPPVHVIQIRDGISQEVERWLKLVQIPDDIEWCKLPELKFCLWQDLGEWVDKRVRRWIPKINDELPTFKDDVEEELGGPNDFSIDQLKRAVRKITKYERTMGGRNG